MGTITGIFLKREYNPVSIAIRCAVPMSLFRMAKASHVVALDGKTGFAMEASMVHGVRRVLVEEALKGTTEVARIDYEVPCAADGLLWMRDTANRRAPYDFKGAFGLGLAPDRDWQDPSKWFCYEYFAKGLVEAGRKVFVDCSHVSGNLLMSITPKMGA